MSNTTEIPDSIKNQFTFYNEKFFVEVGGVDYERESASSLYHLLTRVKQRGVRDHPIDFYRAQLLHYGFWKEFKTKDQMKRKLLASFKQGFAGEMILEVPAAILKLEEGRREHVWKPLSGIYRGTFVYPAFTIETRMALFSLDRKMMEAILLDVFRADDNIGSFSIGRALDHLGLAKNLKGRTGHPAGSNEEILARFFSLDKDLAEKILDYTLQDHYDMECFIRHELVKLGVLKSGGTCNYIKYPEGYTGKKMRKDGIVQYNDQDPETSNQPRRSKRAKFRKASTLCTGKYALQITDAMQEWEEYFPGELDPLISFAPSSSGSHFWGGFNIGSVYGYIRSVGRPPSKSGEKVEFRWRGIAECDEMFTLVVGATGYVTFWENGAVDGTIAFESDGKHEPATLTFHGHNYMDKSRDMGGQVLYWKREWRLHNDPAHEEENDRDNDVAVVDSPMDSDTTDDESDEDVVGGNIIKYTK